MALLALFLLRLTSGLALGMALVSPRQVTSGYFRNNLYVTLGMSALAALLNRAAAPEAFWYATLATVASYAGSVCWLYERSDLGRVSLLIVALASLVGTFVLLPSRTGGISHDAQFTARHSSTSAGGETTSTADTEAIQRKMQRLGDAAGFLRLVVNVSSGLLLGLTMAAMLLGHWYLNSPTMELRPLRRLIAAMGAAVALQMVVSSCGLWGEFAAAQPLSTQWALFVILRWTFGLLGVAAMAWMAWQTLKIPNTQSATGILYVAVIGAFVGETMSLLLSAESLFPI